MSSWQMPTGRLEPAGSMMQSEAAKRGIGACVCLFIYQKASGNDVLPADEGRAN